MALGKILLAVGKSKDSEKAGRLILNLAPNDMLNVVIIHVCNEIPSAINAAHNSEGIKKQFGDVIGAEA